MKNKRGFSLTEILVTLGILAIVSSIAIMGHSSYVTTSEKRAVRIALHEMWTAFTACMSYNKFNSDKCITMDQVVGYEDSKMGPVILKVNEENGGGFCLVVKISDKSSQKGMRGCIQYTNGEIVRKCFEKEKSQTITGKATCRPEGCCHLCKYTCEVGKGGKAPDS